MRRRTHATGNRDRARLGRTVLLFLLCALLASSAHATDTNPPPAAKFKISGYGFLGDLRLKRIINLLEVQKKKPQFFDANFMEDTALILKSKVRDDVYLNPPIVITVFPDEGKSKRYFWNEPEPLP